MKSWSTDCTDTIQWTIIYYPKEMAIALNLVLIITHVFQINNKGLHIFSLCGKPYVPHFQSLIMFLSKEKKEIRHSVSKQCFVLF